jgi:hypothetical protein
MPSAFAIAACWLCEEWAASTPSQKEAPERSEILFIMMGEPSVSVEEESGFCGL